MSVAPTRFGGSLADIVRFTNLLTYLLTYLLNKMISSDMRSVPDPKVVKKCKVLPEPHGPSGGADLRFHSP